MEDYETHLVLVNLNGFCTLSEPIQMNLKNPFFSDFYMFLRALGLYILQHFFLILEDQLHPPFYGTMKVQWISKIEQNNLSIQITKLKYSKIVLSHKFGHHNFFHWTKICLNLMHSIIHTCGYIFPSMWYITHEQLRIFPRLVITNCCSWFFFLASF